MPVSVVKVRKASRNITYIDNVGGGDFGPYKSEYFCLKTVLNNDSFKKGKEDSEWFRDIY